LELGRQSEPKYVLTYEKQLNITVVFFGVMTPYSLVSTSSPTSMIILNANNELLDNGRYNYRILIRYIDVNVEKTSRFRCSGDGYGTSVEV
jgi:hypothetical protein